jgi:hypothetical protein
MAVGAQQAQVFRPIVRAVTIDMIDSQRGMTSYGVYFRPSALPTLLSVLRNHPSPDRVRNNESLLVTTSYLATEPAPNEILLHPFAHATATAIATVLPLPRLPAN